LNFLHKDFPFAAIEINAAGKPFVQDSRLQFNISHTQTLAVAILSDTQSVGVDAEKINARVLKIQHKFINQAEKAHLVGKTEMEQISILTKYWSIKEAVYKWWGKGSVEFANDICIQASSLEHEVVKVIFKKETGIALEVNCLQLDEHWVTYIVE
jgi:phosphopantetheinyl transferase